MNAFLNLLFVVSTGASLYGTPLSETTVCAPAPVQVTWADVQEYIDVHATQTDAVTEGMLQDEAEAGVTTWVTFTGSSGGGTPSLSPLDGPGIGWPAAGRVILFATWSETVTAADMILAVTGSRPSGPSILGAMRPAAGS